MWKEKLKSKGLLVSDGVYGTEINRRGFEPGDVHELWNATHPDEVTDIGKSFVDAGSDIIMTNTFCGNRLQLEKHGLGDRTVELNTKAVEHSLQAAAGKTLVFASVGPTGEFMAPLGTRTEKEIIDCFAEQTLACAQAGCQGVVLETFTDLKEVLAAITAARMVCTLPVAACMSFDKGPKTIATMMGITPSLAAEKLDRAGADIVGSNCGMGSDTMVEVMREMRSATNKPLWAKPNAGLPQLVDGQTVFNETPDRMAARVKDLVAAGANIIGGCCGTTPGHVRAVSQAVRENREFALKVSGQILAVLTGS